MPTLSAMLQTLLVALAGVLSVCWAAPVHSDIAMSNPNTVYMAVVIFAGIGAVLGACVCCRRRKQGFEPNQVKDRKEFENESGALDAARTTEFPIFRALSSPHTQRSATASSAAGPESAAGVAASPSAAAVGSAPVSVPPMLVLPPQVQAVPAQLALAEGLIVPARQQQEQDPNDAEMDNNNGPISPADLQNIANNNAVEFIPNLNEIAAAEAAAAARVARANAAAVAAVSVSVPLQSAAAPPERSRPLEPLSPGLNYENNPFLASDHGDVASAVQLGDIRIDIDDIESTEAPLLQRTPPRSAPISPPAAIVSSSSHGSRLQNVVGRSVPAGYRQLSSDADIADTCVVMQQQQSQSSPPQSPTQQLRLCEDVPNRPQLCATVDDPMADSVAEVNSVEEALRALDFAISGEDSLQLFDEDDDDDDDDDCDDVDDEEVNVVEGAEAADILAAESAKRIAQVDACHEAKQLVDDVLQQALLIAANRQQQHTTTTTTSNVSASATAVDAPALSIQSAAGRVFDATESLNDTVVDRTFATTSHMPKDNAAAKELPPNTPEPHTPLDPNDSSDSAFDFDTIPIEASTPFVSKHQLQQHHPPSDAQPTRKISHKLFDNVLGSAASPSLDDSLGTAQFSPIVADEATFTAPADGTFVAENAAAVADGTFVCAANATFDAADRTFPATSDAAPRGSGQLPPEIRISGEADTVSVDLTTATPVNTPIELNYSLDSWDKFISSSMQQKPPPQQTTAVDQQQPCTSRQAREADAKAAAAAAAASTAGVGTGNETFEMNSSGWFVAASQAGNDTFDVNATVTVAKDGANGQDGDADVDDDDDEDAVEDGALLSLTFDALRKQLAEALPHAQGSMAGPQEFSDDEDEAAGAAATSSAGADSDFDFEPQQSTAAAELHINYNFANFKRALSPIAEESEDETTTCKTFVMNDTTKCADNNSTSCSFAGDAEGETGEAIILGVTRQLMASNDTLFNFEDTLGDRDDPFSPRTPSTTSTCGGLIGGESNMSRSTSNTSSVYECRTPTAAAAIPSPTADTATTSERLRHFQPLDFGGAMTTTTTAVANVAGSPTTTTVVRTPSIDADDLDDIFVPEWDAAFASATAAAVAAADLLSPDQQKTFSEDMCTTIIEHGGGGGTSSDLSLTIDATFSGTDDRTCITAAAAAGATSNNGTNSTAGVSRGMVSEEEGFGDVEDADERTTGDVDNAPASTTTTTAAQGVQREDFFELPPATVPPPSHADQQQLHLSGEEDPWADDGGMMSTAFGPTGADSQPHSSEWDSDVDDSSEEFEYVKGAADDEENSNSSTAASATAAAAARSDDGRRPDSLGAIGEDEVWNAHADKIPVGAATKDQHATASNDSDDDDDEDNENKAVGGDDDEDDDDSSASSGAEGEWVPSCWDSMAQPVRSALKSPDKTSSEEDSSGSTANKKRRSVAFKKQNYHSVYEYPKEVVSLSPAYSEPHMGAWERNFGGNTSNTARLFDAPAAPFTVAALSGATTDLTGLDGFTVSSSQRPFHGAGNSSASGGGGSGGGSQFNAQCHTWPTGDADFSWSQIQEDNESQKENLYATYSDMQIKWPKGLGDFFCSEQVVHEDGNGGGGNSGATDDDGPPSMQNGDSGTRPDSGVGESAELLTDSSLGDLCHTKASLRLPLNLLTIGSSTPMAANGVTTETASVKAKNDEGDDDDDDDGGFGAAAAFTFNAMPPKQPTSTQAEEDDEYDDELVRRQQRAVLDAILPTPSCTGSMDSLSSSSGSERQVSFTTFGKRQQQQHQQPTPQQQHQQANNFELTNNDSDSSSSGRSASSSSTNLHHRQRPAMVFIDDATMVVSPAHDGQLFRQKTGAQNGTHAANAAALAINGGKATVVNSLNSGPLTTAVTAMAATANKQQSDSTDEDSGIESIMRIAKEPNHIVN